MASPFKRPDIDYKPQAAEVVDVPVQPDGEDGVQQGAAEVSAVLDMLIEEVKIASSVVDESLSSLAISDGDGVLTSMVQSILSTEKPPTSVSYHTYSVLGNRSDAASVRSVFEEKAYSVWGDASIAFVDSLSLVASEAIKAKSFLDSGVTDKKVISAIERWAGLARSFTVDAVKIASAKATDDLKNEASIYAGNAIDVQKSAIIGASVISSEIKGSLSRIKQMYASGNVYDSVVDNGPTVRAVTSGVVASLLDLHVDVSRGVKDDLSQDIDYRTEAFSETIKGLIASVSKLKTTQMINSEISSYGVSELEVDDVVTTKPDVAYDQKVLSQVRTDEQLSDNTSLSLSRVMKSVSESVDPSISNLTSQIGGLAGQVSGIQSSIATVMPWHTKAIHDSLGIDAATVNGKSYADLVAAFAASGHNHDAAYSGLSHNHNAAYLGITSKASDSDKLDGIDSTGFLLAGGTAVNSDKLDNLHASDFVLGSSVSGTYKCVKIISDFVNTGSDTTATSGWRLASGFTWNSNGLTYVSVPGLQQGDILELSGIIAANYATSTTGVHLAWCILPTTGTLHAHSLNNIPVVYAPIGSGSSGDSTRTASPIGAFGVPVGTTELRVHIGVWTSASDSVGIRPVSGSDFHTQIVVKVWRLVA